MAPRLILIALAFCLASSLPAQSPGRIYLGIDVLQEAHFAAISGKRIGLLTHVAGVNRNGISTIEILRHAPNVKLVALFSPEHGVRGDYGSGQPVPDAVDKATGLPAYSFYAQPRARLISRLKGVDVLLIDLQDIGVRSYSFAACMKAAIEAAFEARVEVVILDRPNPLGGVKIDGPLLDREFISGIGPFRLPYVHGLTLGEIARMAVAAPRVLDIDPAVRAKGRLTVVPMRGWHRNMRWPETGLRFIPSSPNIRDFDDCVGYAMTGPGTQFGGFTNGSGTSYSFGAIFFNSKPVESWLPDLLALPVHGVGFKKITTTNNTGKAISGVAVVVTDWEKWRPTELSFYLMRLAGKLSGRNPFASATSAQAHSLNIVVGSLEWWNALARDGARVNVEHFLADWQQRDLIYQQAVRRYWIYN